MAILQPSRIQLNLDDLSTKQRNVILSIIKDIGFNPMEIGEVVIKITVKDEKNEADENSL